MSFTITPGPTPAQQGLALLRLSRLHRQRFQERQPWPYLPTAAELAQPSPALLRAAGAYVMSGKFGEDRVSICRDTVLVATGKCPTALPGEVLENLPCAEMVSRVEVHFIKDSLYGTVTVPTSLIPRLEPVLTNPETDHGTQLAALNEFIAECLGQPDTFPHYLVCPGGDVTLTYMPDVMEENLAANEIDHVELGFLLDADSLGECRILAGGGPIPQEVVARGVKLLGDAGRIPIDAKDDLLSAIVSALLCQDPVLSPVVHREARRRLAAMAAQGVFCGLPDYFPLPEADWEDEVITDTFARALPAATGLHDLEDRLDAIRETLFEVTEPCLPQLRERLAANHLKWKNEMKEMHGDDFDGDSFEAES